MLKWLVQRSSGDPTDEELVTDDPLATLEQQVAYAEEGTYFLGPKVAVVN